MVIPDHARARHYLAHLNYYRIGAYWLPFEADHSTHQFVPDTNFEDVLALYVFDRELRLLVMDAIERVEVSVRTQWAYHLAHTYGPHAFLDRRLFKNNVVYQRCLASLRDELARSQELFVKHYQAKYRTPDLPPVWAAVEVMSLGQLSKWYSNLLKRRDRQRIAEIYDMNEVTLTSFLHHLTVMRNHCAHHGRLWNRLFGLQMKMPTRPTVVATALNRQEPKKIYNTTVLLEYLLEIISPGTHWKNRLVGLFDAHPIAKPSEMGFPASWRELPVWNQ